MQFKKTNNVANAFTSLFLYTYISMKPCLSYIIFVIYLIISLFS